MAFQPAGQTAATVARYTGGLLPHLLTLTPWGGGYFLLCTHAFTDICFSTVRYPELPGLSSTGRSLQRQDQLLQNFKELCKNS